MNTTLAPLPLDASFTGFLLGSADAVLVLDAQLRVGLINPSARALLGGAARALPASLEQVLGHAAALRVRALLSDATGGAGEGGSGAEPLPITLADGRLLKLTLHRFERVHRVLRLVAAEGGNRVRLHENEDDAAHALIGMFHESPFPSCVQDETFRLIDVNEAFVRFTGHAREQLLGRDPSGLQPEPDRTQTLEARRHAAAEPPRLTLSQQVERRLTDAEGRERWFRGAQRILADAQGRRLYLSVLQDSSAEHAAREQADRSERDLDQWFDMSPLGMVLFDEAGLLVRTNAAFEALIGAMPVLLGDAALSVQQLMAWDEGGPSAQLRPGAAPLVREGWVPRHDGSQRRLRALVRSYDTPAGHRRYMAALQDLSAEEERDLARMQIGALMDTAGVGVATFQAAQWLESGSLPRTLPSEVLKTAPAAPQDRGALQSIGRDLVLAESLPEYERVQQALRSGQRIEARYAIRHPELGLRWLLTRVEPGQLASGKRTLSVVTLDVTDRQQAQARNEQLLQELGTILESSPAGIVYMRGETVLRCNRRFEHLIGLAPGAAAGGNARDLAAGKPLAERVVRELLAAVQQGDSFETEFELPHADGLPQWITLSARGLGQQTGARDVIAVLSDVSRLKLQQAELERLARDRELMFSLSEVGIAFLREGRIQRANEALERLTGLDAQALAGLEIGALFADRARFHQLWAVEDAALRQQGRWSGERQLRRADGSLVWVQVSKRLVARDDPGGGIIASYVDVDGRRRAEASLAQQAETTRAVLDSVLVGIVTVGREGIEWMNRSARRMFGGGLADFIGQPISTVATDDPAHPLRRSHYLDALVEGQAETFECRLKARDGREFWVAGNAVVTRHLLRGRQLTYALLDIERRRSAELRTAQAQASLQRIIDMAPMAITLRDARSLQVLQANQTALALTGGRSVEEAVGRTPEQTWPVALAERMRQDMEAALSASEPLRCEYPVEADGATRVWDTRYLPLAGGDDAPEQLLAVATDVTEQRAAEQARLEAALAQRDMLVKEVHHRIKNNLQGVAGLMQQVAVRRPEVAEVIAEVVGQVQAIAQVYGLQVGVAGPLRVRSVVEAITGSVQRTFGRDITTAIDGALATQWHQWALPEAESIPIALTVNELLTNAVKHGQPGPLACRVRFDAGGVGITISNLGRLPEGFDLARVPGGVSGLGLVRALLPRRRAQLSITQEGSQVVAAIELTPPGVTWLTPL